jgi:hypothetical protein
MRWDSAARRPKPARGSASRSKEAGGDPPAGQRAAATPRHGALPRRPDRGDTRVGTACGGSTRGGGGDWPGRAGRATLCGPAGRRRPRLPPGAGSVAAHNRAGRTASRRQSRRSAAARRGVRPGGRGARRRHPAEPTGPQRRRRPGPAAGRRLDWAVHRRGRRADQGGRRDRSGGADGPERQ